jgi:hypothetical protein
VRKLFRKVVVLVREVLRVNDVSVSKDRFCCRACKDRVISDVASIREEIEVVGLLSAELLDAAYDVAYDSTEKMLVLVYCCHHTHIALIVGAKLRFFLDTCKYPMRIVQCRFEYSRSCKL